MIRWNDSWLIPTADAVSPNDCRIFIASVADTPTPSRDRDDSISPGSSNGVAAANVFSFAR
jgi:hypothetical protein